MTKTIEITLYSFDELEGAAKEKAVQRYHENWMDHDWYQCTYDMMKEEGEHKHGFRVDDIRFSGFWSQGDGASWCGAVNIKDWIATKPSEYQTHATTQIILALIEEGWVDERVLVSFGNHRYCHEYTMDITEIGMHEPEDEDVKMELGMFKGASAKELCHIVGCAAGALYDMDKEIKEDVIAFARTIYRELEDDYRAQTTEEAIGEAYAINDVWFDESGRMA